MTDSYTVLAAEFRRLADGFDALAGRGLAEPYVSLGIQPADLRTNEAEQIQTIDTVAQILLGRGAQTVRLSGGTFHHRARREHGPSFRAEVFGAVTDPALRNPAGDPEQPQAPRARRPAGQMPAVNEAVAA